MDGLLRRLVQALVPMLLAELVRVMEQALDSDLNGDGKVGA